MNNWLQRWHGMAPREQWLALSVGLVVCALLYMLLLGDPLSARLAKQQASFKVTEARRLEAQSGLADLQAKLAADPNIPYRSALLAASASREELIRQIDQNTAELVTPQKMKAVLAELLRSQPRLQLVGLESFSEPMQLPGAAPVKLEPGAEPAPVTLYRHGLHLQLQGGYFDLLAYLQAVQASGWKLNWDSLDYQVGDGGPSQAKISLKLYTLSRQAGWVGV
ncbi:type II secretion system protein M [Pseudomonas sp. J452]|uniref:type II secretion system protein M n=1 Tax=Pseudomonas sp. J452 TaxID=2898441 RepID=UPI0021ADF09F|nr:type II secretion system protein M [Pseudomonas sp. J452]UUY09875.1 type II secretion system protein M [Pseudomonas sp. J452]